MILKHLRRNVVAYLALIVALSTGTAYAAGLANGSVTAKKLAKNAVTSPKIKNNTVQSGDLKDGSLTSADVKNGSLASADIADGTIAGADLASGLIPGQVDIAFANMNSTGDPEAAPDFAGIFGANFTAAASGKAYLRWFAEAHYHTCGAGDAFAGIYLDGSPVPATEHQVGTTPGPLELVAIVPVSAGDHQATIGIDCPDGSAGSGSNGYRTWTILVQPE